MQALQAICQDMQSADAEHSLSSEAPNWVPVLAAVQAAIEEGQGYSSRQTAGHEPAASGSSEAPAAEWESTLEQAVTSVLLWAQNASKAQGMRDLVPSFLPYNTMHTAENV